MLLGVECGVRLVGPDVQRLCCWGQSVELGWWTFVILMQIVGFDDALWQPNSVRLYGRMLRIETDHISRWGLEFEVGIQEYRFRACEEMTFIMHL